MDNTSSVYQAPASQLQVGWHVRSSLPTRRWYTIESTEIKGSWITVLVRFDKVKHTEEWTYHVSSIVSYRTELPTAKE